MTVQDSQAHKYNVGDQAMSWDMVMLKMNDAEAEMVASSLKRGDSAFIRRSDGSWTYAIVIKSASEIGLIIEFLVQPDGSTKKVSRGHWGKCVRAFKHIRHNDYVSPNIIRPNSSTENCHESGEYLEFPEKKMKISINCAPPQNIIDEDQNHRELEDSIRTQPGISHGPSGFSSVPLDRSNQLHSFHKECHDTSEDFHETDAAYAPDVSGAQGQRRRWMKDQSTKSRRVSHRRLDKTTSPSVFKSHPGVSSSKKEKQDKKHHKNKTHQNNHHASDDTGSKERTQKTRGDYSRGLQSFVPKKTTPLPPLSQEDGDLIPNNATHSWKPKTVKRSGSAGMCGKNHRRHGHSQLTASATFKNAFSALMAEHKGIASNIHKTDRHDCLNESRANIVAPDSTQQGEANHAARTEPLTIPKRRSLDSLNPIASEEFPQQTDIKDRRGILKTAKSNANKSVRFMFSSAESFFNEPKNPV